jgi:hypothetical protein
MFKKFLFFKKNFTTSVKEDNILDKIRNKMAMFNYEGYIVINSDPHKVQI